MQSTALSNAYVERLIGSVRRECLNQVIVLNEAHLKRLLAEYFECFHQHRPHQGIDGDAPHGRSREPPEISATVATPFLGGLHHRYAREAA
ncbi:integrase core domain-containing protein [Adhaeretor mobilis]|uniref:integrase core domain-containing protein n=1 Tax=Adhaeretor mobilis TaxID=1930276 RepID=UPI00119E63E3|nr:integrase core domain-containing protein [Adhaeretor mobilis]